MNNLAYTDDMALKQRFELLNGKVVMMSPRPRIDHLCVVGNIYRQFANYLSGKKCIAYPDGADVYLDEKNKFIPDGMIVCNRDIIKPDGIHGAPDLVVEVLSRSTAKNDRTIKKDAYAKAGVKEYWLVDIGNKAVEVYLNRDHELQLNAIYYYLTDAEIQENTAKNISLAQEINVSICDNLVVRLPDIFENLLF